jgi:hypothetical protein
MGSWLLMTDLLFVKRQFSRRSLIKDLLQQAETTRFDLLKKAIGQKVNIIEMKSLYKTRGPGVGGKVVLESVPRPHRRLFQG